MGRRRRDGGPARLLLARRPPPPARRPPAPAPREGARRPRLPPARTSEARARRPVGPPPARPTTRKVKETDMSRPAPSRRAFLTGLTSLTLTLAACGANSRGTAPASGTPSAGGTLYVLSSDTDVNWDPARSQSLAVTSLGLVHRRLTTWELSPGGEPRVVPDLATDTGTVSADGLTWTYTLKEGLVLSDGTPITSARSAPSPRLCPAAWATTRPCWRAPAATPGPTRAPTWTPSPPRTSGLSSSPWPAPTGTGPGSSPPRPSPPSPRATTRPPTRATPSHRVPTWSASTSRGSR